MSHETEKYSRCPYNESHIILRYRMNTHLVKCRKQHQSLDWGRCSHNSNHHLPKVELAYHENHVCPDRHSFQASIIAFNNEEFKSLAPIEHIEVPVCEENWDEGPTNHFDPSENARQKSTIRGVHCVPPAERKAFRLEHRRHIREREEDPCNMGTSKTTIKEEPMKSKVDAPLEPLRYPKELPKGFISMGRGQPQPSSSGPSATSNLVSPGAVRTPTPLQGVQWSGLGRGSIPEVQSSLSATGAWGRGRPRI